MSDEPTSDATALGQGAGPSASPSGRDLAGLAARLGHRFADESLLELALRHRSWCAEHGGVTSNERLEFLGDSVLGIVVTDHLYRTESELPEGTLAQRRAELVNARTLADVARSLDLGDHLALGRGERLAGGAQKTSILSDAVEAVFGAVFLDAGLVRAGEVILDLLADHLAEVSAGREGDHKSRLQELAARRFERVPAYVVTGEGPDHERWFAAQVSIGDDVWGRGEGRTKKQAEQAAAEAALDAVADGDVDTAALGPENGAHHG